MRLPSPDELRASIAQDELATFIQLAWPLVEHRRAYKSNWHIEAICEHLQAVSAGELLRLIINIPPRHMKSLAVAVFWPCWHWLREPEAQWLFASYAEKLSKRDSLKCRRIVESRGGRAEGGTLLERVGYAGLLALLGEDWGLASDQNEKMRFENTRTGYRLATSVGGTATGEGGDILVVDDPHKADEVDTETGVQRENVIDWMDGTLSSRLNDPNTGRVVVVMQRLHELDVTGHLLTQGGYEHLCLPAEYEPSHPFVWPDDPRTEPGELLWPDHFGHAALDDLKLRMGSYRSAGQLQQRPAPAEGGIFRTAWWRYYDPALFDELELTGEWGGPVFKRVWQAWDTALKEKTTSDWTVGQVWGQDLGDVYLLRQVRGRWGLTESITQVRQLSAWVDERFPAHGAHPKYVENTANGPEVVAALRHQLPGVIPVSVSTDKTSRAEAVTPQIEAGNVHLPGHRVMTANGWAPDPARTPLWVQEFIGEHASFPNGAFDDQVDTTTLALDPRRRMFKGGQRRREGRRPVTAGLSARDV